MDGMDSKLNSSELNGWNIIGLNVITGNWTVMEYSQWTETVGLNKQSMEQPVRLPPSKGVEIKKILRRKLPFCPFFEHTDNKKFWFRKLFLLSESRVIFTAKYFCIIKILF